MQGEGRIPEPNHAWNWNRRVRPLGVDPLTPSTRRRKAKDPENSSRRWDEGGAKDVGIGVSGEEEKRWYWFWISDFVLKTALWQSIAVEGHRGSWANSTAIDGRISAGGENPWSVIKNCRYVGSITGIGYWLPQKWIIGRWARLPDLSPFFLQNFTAA